MFLNIFSVYEHDERNFYVALLYLKFILTV